MKKFTLKSLLVLACGFVLMSCENESDATAPLAVSDNKNFGTSPDACEIIEFEDVTNTAPGGAINTVYSDGTPVRISAQLRAFRGRYFYSNAAVLLNTSQPDSRNQDFRTPNANAIRPMGHVLTAGISRGNTTSVYNRGTRLEMDFSAMGSITLKGIHVLDVTEDEAGSKLELLDKNGNVIKTFSLPVTDAYGATRINTEDTPGVVKLRVTFEGARKRSGSGAIDVIEFCRD